MSTSSDGTSVNDIHISEQDDPSKPILPVPSSANAEQQQVPPPFAQQGTLGTISRTESAATVANEDADSETSKQQLARQSFSLPLKNPARQRLHVDIPSPKRRAMSVPHVSPPDMELERRDSLNEACLRDDVAKAMVKMRRAVEYTRADRTASKASNFLNKLMREHETGGHPSHVLSAVHTTLEELSSTPPGTPLALQASKKDQMLKAKLKIFDAWIGELVDEFDHTHAQSAAALSQMRDAYSTLFRMDDPQKALVSTLEQASTSEVKTVSFQRLSIDQRRSDSPLVSDNPHPSNVREVERALQAGSVVLDSDAESLGVAAETVIDDMCRTHILSEAQAHQVRGLLVEAVQSPYVLRKGHVAILTAPVDFVEAGQPIVGLVRLMKPISLALTAKEKDGTRIKRSQSLFDNGKLGPAEILRKKHKSKRSSSRTSKTQILEQVSVVSPNDTSDSATDSTPSTPTILHGVERKESPTPSSSTDNTEFVVVILGSHKGGHVSSIVSEFYHLFRDRQFRIACRRADTAADIEEAMELYTGQILLGEDMRERERLDEDFEDGFVPPGGPLSGMIADFKRRLVPHYNQDWKDGLKGKCLATIIFLSLACLAPAIAFGGVMGDKTGQNIGVIEMLLATAISSFVWIFVAGQPLIILGGTGPLLIFTQVLYDTSKQLEIDFLPFYAMTGIWTAAILFALAVFNGSQLMRHCTRFTDEVFLALIAMIFIVQPLQDIYKTWDHHRLPDTSSSYQPITNSVVELVLMVGTVWLTFAFKGFKTAVFFSKRTRKSIANFAPIAATIIMTALHYLFFSSVNINMVVDSSVQAGLVTTNGRPWFVDLSTLPTWAYFGTSIPAMLCAILIFLEHQICARVLASPAHRLKRGTSYHYDLAILALTVLFCSFMALPWMVGATVRTLTHVHALAKFEQPKKGEISYPRITFVLENRITGFGVAVVIFVACFAMGALQTVPSATMLGLFVFMGITSLAGNQFISRIRLMFLDAKLMPDAGHTKISKTKIHLFTFIQVLCLALLWGLKLSPLAIAFPVFIAALMPLRNFISRRYGPHDMALLDSEEEDGDFMF